MGSTHLLYHITYQQVTLHSSPKHPKAHQRRDRAGYLRQQIRKGEKGARPERSGGRHAPTGLAAKPTGGERREGVGVVRSLTCLNTTKHPVIEG